MNPYVALGAVALWAASVGGAYMHGRSTGETSVQGKWDAQKADDLGVEVQRGIDNARETQRRLDAQRTKDESTEKELDGLRLALRSGAAVADGLRSDYAAFIVAHRERATSSASTEGERQAAYDASMRTASDLYQRADELAGKYAGAFDEARLRGLACQADYTEVEGRKATGAGAVP